MLLDVSLEQAQSIILSHIPALASEELSLMESLGRVLAADYHAVHDLPLQSRSAVDGYAVAVTEAPSGSNFVLKAPPLSYGEAEISGEQAMAVTTGGLMPGGTQSVVPHEKTRLQDGKLSVLENIKPGNNIKTGGEDYKQGELLVGSDSVIDAGVAALLAAFGYGQVQVRLRPRVAILGLGSNIVPFQATPETFQIRDSNGPMLAAMIGRDGGSVLALEVASTLVSATDMMRQMLAEADMVICTGGTYAKGANEARQIMESLGVALFYWGVPIQPGSHHGFGKQGSTLVMALSGNPAACAVSYHLYVAPALNSMQGRRLTYPMVKAKCTNGFAKKTGSRRFVRGHARYADDGWQVEVLPGQKPSMLKSLLNCNCLIDLPAGTPSVGVNEKVTIWLL